MKITLEMVDEVINRTGVNYKAAKEALEKFEGDVLSSIVYLEELNQPKNGKKINGQDLIEKLKTLVNEGMVSQILIEKNGKVVVDLPIVAGAIGAVIFTIPTVAAIIAALATGCEIKIVKKEGDVININDLTQEKFDEFMAMINKDKKSTKGNEDDFVNDEDEAVDESELFEDEKY